MGRLQTLSEETSVMTDLEQCDTEQAPGQDTKMCLGLEQGRHCAEFSGTPWGEEHVGRDSLAQTSFCDISSSECVLRATHWACNPWIKNRLHIWDSRAIVNSKMTLHTDTSRSLHWPIAIPAHLLFGIGTTYRCKEWVKTWKRNCSQWQDSHHSL